MLNRWFDFIAIHQEELKHFFKTLGKKTSIFFNTESSSLKVNSKVIADIIKRYQFKKF